MAKFKYKAPDGTPFEVEAEDQAHADMILQTHVVPDYMRNKGIKPPEVVPPPPTVQPGQIPYGPSEATNLPHPAPAKPSFSESVQAGMGHGIDKAGLGIKGLFGNLDEDDQRRLAIGAARTKAGGMPALAGQVGTELAAFGGGTGAAANTAGRVLTKAVPKAAELAKLGYGKLLTLGNSANAATQGGMIGGLVAPEAGETRVGNAEEGAIAGAASPLVGEVVAAPFKLGSKLVKTIKNLVKPSTEHIEGKAYDALVKHVGEEGMADSLRAIEHAPPESVLPRTTAAMTGNKEIAQLERGGRLRRNFDYPSHDEAVGHAAWNEASGVVNSEAGQALLSKFERNGVPQTKQTVGYAGARKPMLEDQPLRQTLGKVAPGLNTTEHEVISNLADELAQYEKAKGVAGATAPDVGLQNDPVSAFLAIYSAIRQSPTAWKVRSAYNNRRGAVADKIVNEIDQAVGNPKRFQQLAQSVQTKRAAGTALTATEQAFDQIMRAAGRATADKQ